jgi:hypothetical protein
LYDINLGLNYKNTNLLVEHISCGELEYIIVSLKQFIKNAYYSTAHFMHYSAELRVQDCQVNLMSFLSVLSFDPDDYCCHYASLYIK